MFSNFLLQQVKEIYKIIYNYPINDLEVLVEASQVLQKQTQTKQEQYTQRMISMRNPEGKCEYKSSLYPGF